MVYSQRLWAQDVYQLPPDSCVGWPAVNCVSDSPLLLLIVSISVPAEKWGCCGQTQSYWSLRLVPDLPAARRGRDGRKKKKKGGRVEPPWHSQTQRLPPGRGNWRCSGEFSLFQVAALYFKMIQLRPFVHLNSDNCFFFSPLLPKTQGAVACLLTLADASDHLFWVLTVLWFCVYVCAPRHHVAVGSKYQIWIWIKKKKKKMTTAFK